MAPLPRSKLSGGSLNDVVEELKRRGGSAYQERRRSGGTLADVRAVLGRRGGAPSKPGEEFERDPTEGIFPLYVPPTSETESPLIGTEAGLSKPLEQPDPLIEKAAEFGILFDRPMESGHGIAGFAFAPEDRIRAFEIANTDPTGVRPRPVVRVGPETGELEYFVPEEGRFALVTPPGHSGVKRLQEWIGPSATIIPEIVGGAVGVILGRSPLFVNTGASAGAFAGEIARLSLGRSMGINERLTDRDMIESAATVAGFSFAGGIAGDRVYAMGRIILDLVGAKVISKQALNAAGMDVTDAARIAEEINTRLSGQQLKFNLAQATNDKDLLIQQEYFKRSPEFATLFSDFTDAQSRALRSYYEAINKPYVSRLPDATAVGKSVQDVAKTHVGKEELKASLPVQMADAELRSFTSTMKSQPHGNFGPQLRNLGDAQQKAFKEHFDAAAKDLNDFMGDTPFIGIANANGAATKLSREADAAIFPGQLKENEALIGVPRARRQGGTTTKGIERTETRFPEGGVEIETATGVVSPTGARGGGRFEQRVPEVGAEGEPTIIRTIIREEISEAETVAVNKLRDPNTRLTFQEAWDALSYLKRLISNNSSGQIKDSADVGSVKMMAAALEKDMRVSMQSTAARGMYDDFVTKYARENDRLFRGAIGASMQRQGGPNGRFVIADEALFTSTVFRAGDTTSAKQVMALVGDDPATAQAVRQSIVDLYKKRVGLVETGRVDMAAHRRFMADYGEKGRDVLSVFFDGRGEKALFNKAGGMERALQARETARKVAVDKINKTTAGEVANLNNPSRVVSWMMDPSNTERVTEIMRIIDTKATPDILRGVRSEIQKRVAKKVMGEFINGERVLSGVKFNDLLVGREGREGAKQITSEGAMLPVLEIVFGKQYVKDLKTLNKAIIIAQRQPATANPSGTSFWGDTVKGLARAYVGLFTRPGRVITAVARIRGRAANKALTRAILNPEDLGELVSLKGVDARSRRAATFLGNAGASAFLSESEGAQDIGRGITGFGFNLALGPPKVSARLPPPRRGIPVPPAGPVRFRHAPGPGATPLVRPPTR